MNRSNPADWIPPAATFISRSSCSDVPRTSGVRRGSIAPNNANDFVTTGMVSPARLSDQDL